MIFIPDYIKREPNIASKKQKGEYAKLDYYIIFTLAKLIYCKDLPSNDDIQCQALAPKVQLGNAISQTTIPL